MSQNDTFFCSFWGRARHLSKRGCSFLIFCCSLYLAHNIAYALDTLPPHAMKVTNKDNPNCINYFTYKNELYCTSTFIKTNPIDPHLLAQERQHIVFDNRTWHAAWGEHKAHITSIEYVLAGQSINNWHELITSQFIPGLPSVSAKEFAQRLFADLKKSGLVYTARILEHSKNSVLLEFQVQQPQKLQQDELQKIVKGVDGFYVLHYAIKSADMGEENRKKWRTNLLNSSVKDTSQVMNH